MEASSSMQRYCIKWNLHRDNLMDTVLSLRRNDEFVDTTITVAGRRTFKCHKVILAACSDYLRRILQFAYGSEYSPVEPTIIITDVEWIYMDALLDYLYSGHVEIGNEHMEKFLKLGLMLEIKGLVEMYHKSLLKSKSESKSKSPGPVVSSTEPNSPPRYNHSPSSDDYTVPSTNSSVIQYRISPSDIPNVKNVYAGSLWGAIAARTLAPSENLGSSMFNSDCDNALGKKMKNLILNQNPEQDSLLRHALAEGNVDAAHVLASIANSGTPEPYQYPSNDYESDGNSVRRSSSEQSPRQHIEPNNYAEVVIDEGDDPHQIHGHRKPKEWKRYKQYTKEHMDMAIEEVQQKKMTALKAANKYGIPSRTLYDKVKKMGIKTVRTARRTKKRLTQSASFPTGYGRNRNGNIYNQVRSHSESGDHDNVIASTSSAPDLTNEHAEDLSSPHSRSYTDSEVLSPPVLSLPGTSGTSSLSSEPDSDMVQDLSVNRRNVIVAPQTVIKEEKLEPPQK